MSIIDTVTGLASPHLLLIKLAAVGVVLAGAAYGGWHARGVVAQRDIAEIHATHAAALAREIVQARADERAVQTKQSEAINAAAAKVPAFRAAVVRAVVAGDGMRKPIDAIAASCKSDPAAVAAGYDAADATRVLADVLGEMGAVGRIMAATATERGIALEACVQSYNALIPKEK
jgi:hypothetical protein